jgi:serine/threonine protein kinase
VDFGLARTNHAGERAFTKCGSMDYLAPEHHLGRGYTREVDLWALGVWLFELLTGTMPFFRSG